VNYVEMIMIKPYAIPTLQPIKTEKLFGNPKIQYIEIHPIGKLK
jgi:hypothetical protein